MERANVGTASSVGELSFRMALHLGKAGGAESCCRDVQSPYGCLQLIPIGQPMDYFYRRQKEVRAPSTATFTKLF